MVALTVVVARSFLLLDSENTGSSLKLYVNMGVVIAILGPTSLLHVQ